MTILEEFYNNHYKSKDGCEFKHLSNAALRSIKVSKEFREFMLEKMFERQAKAIEENRIAVEALCKAVNAMQMSLIGFQERFGKDVQNALPKVGIDLKSVEIPDMRFDIEPIRKAYLREQRIPDEDVLTQFNKQVDSWGLTEDQEKLRLVLGNELSKAPLSEQDFQKYKELQVLFGEFTYAPYTRLYFEPLSHEELYELIDKWANSPAAENEDIGFDRIFKSSELIKLHRYKHYTKRI